MRLSAPSVLSTVQRTLNPTLSSLWVERGADTGAEALGEGRCRLQEWALQLFFRTETSRENRVGEGGIESLACFTALWLSLGVEPRSLCVVTRDTPGASSPYPQECVLKVTISQSRVVFLLTLDHLEGDVRNGAGSRNGSKVTVTGHWQDQRAVGDAGGGLVLGRPGFPGGLQHQAGLLISCTWLGHRGPQQWGDGQDNRTKILESILEGPGGG